MSSTAACSVTTDRFAPPNPRPRPVTGARSFMSTRTPEQAAADYVATVLSRPRSADATLSLYLPRSRDHELAVSLGLIDLPRENYTALVAEIRGLLTARGIRCHIVRVSPSRVVSELERRRLSSTPEARAEVYAAIAQHSAGD